MTIPSPTVLHFRLEPGAVDTKFYPDRDAIFDDLAKTYRQAIRAFYDAGCRYLQLDDTAWAYLCSKVEMEKAKAARHERGQRWPRTMPACSTSRSKAGRPTWW